ncbi:MAG: hypothetical protein ACR2OZ_17025 [Verrucomicrobiales bacterium]
MAERHTVVVRVESGKVSEVLFCECCPRLTLEVRTYTELKNVVKDPDAWSSDVKEGDRRFQRDERGVYESTFHEPEDADD